MAGEKFKRAVAHLLLPSMLAGLTACASHPSWIVQPPVSTISACVIAGKDGWQLAELRAKAQFAESQWLTQHYRSQRQQTNDSNGSDWRYQRQQQTRHLQQGTVPPVQQLARWQGRFGKAQLQCVLVSPLTD